MNNNGKNSTKFLAQAGIIAAIYATLVLIVTFTPARYTSFGNIQLRFSEALTMLPYFTPAAIPGLFVGCLISNIVGAVSGAGLGILDVVFGSLATLAAAYCSHLLRKWKWLVPLPPVVINAVVVGLLLKYTQNLPLLPSMLTVGAGQVVACYFLGMPLLYALEKRRGIFK